jgi:hypothetical protein
MLRKLRDFCFTTKPLDELACDGKKWINRRGDTL